MQDALTRRKLLLGTGAVAAGTAGSIVFGSNTARASVAGEFSIPNGETVLTDATLSDVVLTADVSYTVEANAPIHGVECELHVGATPDTVDMIARYASPDMAQTNVSGTETLTGSLLSASDFEVHHFQPTNGELRSNVVAELRLFALRNGEVVASAKQTETFEVIVRKEELEVAVTLTADGTVTFETA